MTNKARYYIYWNLHKDCYSVRYKGRVFAHYNSIVAEGVTFKVSERGRQRVLRDKRKNVHAFVVAQQIFPQATLDNHTNFYRVKYNPYKYTGFVDDNEKIITRANTVWLTNQREIKVCS